MRRLRTSAKDIKLDRFRVKLALGCPVRCFALIQLGTDIELDEQCSRYPMPASAGVYHVQHKPREEDAHRQCE